MAGLIFDVKKEQWPLVKPFVIARGSKTHAHVVTVTLSAGGLVGRGECVPYARYGETPESVIKQVRQIADLGETSPTRSWLRETLAAGAARNAIDCALWELEAKLTRENVYERLGAPMPSSILSVQTISIGTPEAMAEEARNLSEYPVLKIKLDDKMVLERIAAVHQAAPRAKLLIDANESWCFDMLQSLAPVLAGMAVVMIEQPLRAGQDDILTAYNRAVPLGADESCHTSDDLAGLAPYYDYVNIKLDKAGGLTEALKMKREARELGLGVMVGSMVSTSLALAPAIVLAMEADYVDLDSPNLLAEDRKAAFTLKDGLLGNINTKIWGGGGP